MRLHSRRAGNWDIVVGTTGFLSRELYEYREEKKQGCVLRSAALPCCSVCTQLFLVLVMRC
jgi:hypothetical protein